MTLFGAQRRSGWTAEPIVPPFPGYSPFGGVGTNMDSAMRVSGVWACVRLLADSVSMMPLHAYTIRGGQRVPIADPQLITSPASNTTMSDWVYMVMVSMLLRGNAYGLIVRRDGFGFPTQIELVSPEHVAVLVDRETGAVQYRVDGVERDRSEVFHLPAFRIPGQPTGLSPIAYASRTLSTVSAAERFGEGFFLEGAHPTAVITTDQPLNAEMARQMKDRITASVKGREPAVLGAGAKWQAMQVAPEESQFLETQKFGLSQIARIFGVPPEMIGAEAGSSMTYANVTQRAMDFLTYSVQPWLTRIEQALFPLLPNQRHVRFDTSVLVRLDALTQAQVDDMRLNGGVKTVNEARLPLDLAPVAWGDEPYLPGMKSSAAAAALKPAPVAEEEPPTAEGEPDDGDDEQE